MTFYVNPQCWILMDSLHVATECVPEPTSLVFLGVGALCLLPTLGDGDIRRCRRTNPVNRETNRAIPSRMALFVGSQPASTRSCPLAPAANVIPNADGIRTLLIKPVHPLDATLGRLRSSTRCS